MNKCIVGAILLFSFSSYAEGLYESSTEVPYEPNTESIWDSFRVTIGAGQLAIHDKEWNPKSDTNIGLQIEKVLTKKISVGFFGSYSSFKYNPYEEAMKDSYGHSVSYYSVPSSSVVSEDVAFTVVGAGAQIKMFLLSPDGFSPFLFVGAGHYWQEDSKSIRGHGGLGLNLMFSDSLGLYADIKSIHNISQLSGVEDKSRYFSTNFGLVLDM